MGYRLLVLVLALVLVAFVFGLFWAGSALYLRSRQARENPAERARRMAMWTFMGFGVGLLFAGVGSLVLGSYAFYRVAGEESDAPHATRLAWALAVVVPTGLVAAGLLAVTIAFQ